MKFSNVHVYIKTKVLFKFGSLEIVCVEMWLNKLYKMPLHTCEVSMYAHAFTHVKAPYFVVGL